MSDAHGFELIREREVPELKTVVRHYRHRKTGAELLSAVNDDENKAFGINFRTPPRDSTGVAHILEHAVLCGSRKYPLKDPFAELRKSSLRTFLNAFTYPDKTCYPVASTNVKDFYNLVEVYLDLALHPLLAHHTFAEQGWHYELESPDDPLIYKGVVFNEMKGAYSSPDNLLGRYLQQSLYPDTTYGVDSGGDPRVIPELTWEGLRAFHGAYYHPANARILFYGDDDPEERLRLLDRVLGEFEPREIDSSIGLQPVFDAPRRVEHVYAAGEEDRSDEKRCMATVNWMLGEPPDWPTLLGLEVLSYLLIGTSAAPLRKALIDSGLGSDVAGWGLMDHLRQIGFGIGLKGMAADDVDALERLVLSTLERLASEGVDRDAIDAALNTIEFQLRERNTGGFPRGLALMLAALTRWVYGADPIDAIAFEAPLAEVKSRSASEPYFEALIRRYLLENRHRTTLLLRPDPELGQREVEEERGRLAAVKAGMSADDLARIVAETRELKRLQEAPDAPEALASLPTLALGDLEKRNKTIPIARLDDGRLLHHDLFTSGVLYLDLGMDLHVLPQELLPYLPLFGRALLETGTAAEDEVQVIQRIGRETGGIHRETFSASVYDSPSSASWLFLRGKAMVGQTGKLVGLLNDVLRTARLDHRDRFRQMVLESKARLESRLAPAGSAFVGARLRSMHSEAGWFGEQTEGISYLFFLRDLAERVDSDWPVVHGILERIRALLVNSNAMLCNVTVDEASWARSAPEIQGFLAALPSAPAVRQGWMRHGARRDEGLTFPSPVQYVGKAANVYDAGYALNGSVLAITNYLNSGWLWDKVRKEGGAYGVGCGLDLVSGHFSYTSYRDPNLTGTLDVYDATAGFLRNAPLDREELTRSIIGAIGSMDAYMLPDAKGFASMARYLTGNTDERRQRIRDELLATSEAEFRRFAEALEAVGAGGHVVVLGSPDAIEAANAARPGWLEVTKVL